MNEAVILEYVDLCEQLAAEVLFSEGAEQRFYDRLDQLWYREMSIDDRAEAQGRLLAKARLWSVPRSARDPS